MNINSETDKSSAKMEAIAAFKRGENISQIAKNLHVTRATLYRWHKKSQAEFQKPSPRQRYLIDGQSRLKILEAYFVLRKPALQALSAFIKGEYAIHKSPSQLRRLLAKWKVLDYRPSPVIDSYLSLRGFRAEP